MSGEGWENGSRVSQYDPNERFLRPARPVADQGGEVFGWPSEEDPVFSLGCVSREDAGMLAQQAREQLFFWLAGEGLDPSRVLFRWMMAAARFHPRWEGLEGVVGVMDSNTRWERWVVAQIFPDATGGVTSKEGLAPVPVARAQMERVSGLLKKFAEAGRYGVLRDGRSLSELVDWVSVETLDLATDARMEEARMVVHHSMEMLCRWIAQDGAGPMPVCQRIYALAFERYRVIAPGLSGNDLASLLGQVRATFCEMTKRYFERPLEVQLGYVPKVAGQKSAESSQVYGESAAKHCPRRQLSGDAGMDDGDRRAMKAELDAKQSRKLEEARRQSQERLVERDAEEFVKLMRRHKERRIANEKTKK